MTLTRTHSTASAVHISASQFAYGLAVAAMVAASLYAALVSGPALRVAARAELQQAIAAENRAFCEKFGMPLGTSAFSACSQELAIIRQKQAARDAAAAAGMI